MSAEISMEMVRAVIAELGVVPDAKNNADDQTNILASAIRESTPSSLTLSLLGNPETESEVAKLKSALAYLSPDVGRGQGSFYDLDGNAKDDNWLGVVWGISSLGWSQGEGIARQWSKQSPRFTDEGFDEAWNGFKPHHAKRIGIGSLYKRAKELGWQQATSTPSVTTPSTTNGPRYKLLGSVEINALKPSAQAVKGIFPAQGLGAIFGPSGSGKSFVAFDLAATIAEGGKWFGIRVTAAPVVYAALEGEAGLKLRVQAWEAEKKKSLPRNLFMIMQPFRLTEPHDVADLATVLPKGSVIFIDTLNRAAPTIDENSSKDMGIVLEAAKRLQELTGGLVVLVHHTGKDTSKGARGHSSLFAALDGAIEVERTMHGRAWTVNKVKDGEDGKSLPFNLKVHNLGNDIDGDPLTSCTVERDFGQLFQVREPTGKDQKPALRLIKNEIAGGVDVGKAGAGAATKCGKVEDSILKVAGTLTGYPANKRTNRARAIVQSLMDGHYLSSGLDGDEAWVWLP